MFLNAHSPDGQTFTEDGLESSFAVNHITHYMLIHLLLPSMDTHHIHRELVPKSRFIRLPTQHNTAHHLLRSKSSPTTALSSPQQQQTQDLAYYYRGRSSDLHASEYTWTDQDESRPESHGGRVRNGRKLQVKQTWQNRWRVSEKRGCGGASFFFKKN